MNDMIEAKKDYYRQQQLGITKMGFTFKHSELPESVKDAELGHRFYIVFVDADTYDEQSGNNAQSNHPEKPDSSEGEKLRVRAVLLCKDKLFQEWVGKFTRHNLLWFEATELGATHYIYNICDIKSRSELATNKFAQDKFKGLLAEFDSWKLENQYADNLDRI